MNCKQFQENLVAFLRGELRRKARDEMNRHAEHCPACKRDRWKTSEAIGIASISEEEPVVRITYTFIQQALKSGASDLHFERRGNRLTVRCRVDGVLTDLDEAIREVCAEHCPGYLALLDGSDPAKMLAHAVMARLKEISGVHPIETELPQKGRIGIVLDKKEYSFAVSFMPIEGGEDAVCRIIPKRAPFSLDDLAMSDRLRASIDHIISQPMGVVVIGGPSGSGKTTTALSLVQHLASPNRKTVTVEDPVYYKMENVTQIEVADHKGMTAAALLSRAVWLAPDVVAAPLVRNGEVARKCADLALEGALVMATIHADDAAEALWEFAHMPDRFLPYSCLVGATNQRLVRKICPDCREECTPSSESLKSLGIDPSTMKFEHGAGCEKCRNMGYKNQAQIMEALEVTHELADALAETANSEDFCASARKATSPTLVEDGRQKVLDGVTTAEEVCRVLGLPR